MTRNADEIVRRLEEGDEGHGAPCWVGHGGRLEPCKRPSTFRVYGVPLCPEHGEEAALGAFEEMHQDAHNFLERFDGPWAVDLPNPWVRRVMAEWEHTVPADEAGEPLPVFEMAESIHAWGITRAMAPLLGEDETG